VFAGPGWPRNTDISYERDTITVTFTSFIPPEIPGGPDYALPAPFVFVYFIPFTEKTIRFADIIKREEQ
jgi:hypothetical protein